MTATKVVVWAANVLSSNGPGAQKYAPSPTAAIIRPWTTMRRRVPLPRTGSPLPRGGWRMASCRPGSRASAKDGRTSMIRLFQRIIIAPNDAVKPDTKAVAQGHCSGFDVLTDQGAGDDSADQQQDHCAAQLVDQDPRRGGRNVADEGCCGRAPPAAVLPPVTTSPSRHRPPTPTGRGQCRRHAVRPPGGRGHRGPWATPPSWPAHLRAQDTGTGPVQPRY